MSIQSKVVQAGSPVTAEIINNIVADLQALSAAKSPEFNLTLGAAGAKQDNLVVSQKVYSKIIPKTVKYDSKTGATWTFGENIKFTSPPRCWVQIMNTDTGREATEFEFNIVITSVTTTAMTFQIRAARSFKSGKHDFICFAAESA
jgi:hypothetical protein